MNLQSCAETHEVTNQVPPLDGANLYRIDLPLQQWVQRYHAGWAQARLDVSRCETPRPRDPALAEAAGLALTRAAEGRAEVVLPFSALCSGETCAAVAADGTFRFRDDDHLTEPGARGLAGLLDGRL